MAATIKRLKYLIFVFFFVMAIPCVGSAKTLQTTTNVYLRAGASTNSTALNVLKKGTKVTFIATKGTWKKVSYAGKKGYVCAQYLKNSKTSSGKTVYITANGVNIRKEKGLNKPVLVKVNKGAKLSFVKDYGEWTKVKLSSGVTGYVYTSYIGNTKPAKITASTASSKADKIRKDAIAYCKTRLGDKYSQKYRNKKGYADCSSLMRDAFMKVAGVYIGENTVGQRSKMKKYMYSIDKLEEVRVGDLVYHFTKENINHTGIYLGNNKVLHASSTKANGRQVTISSFKDNGYWQYGCNAAKYCLDH